MTDRTLETRNRIIEATWRAIVKDDKPQPEDGELIIQKNIRTEEGQEETRYSFIYKGEFVAGIIERQNYCDYSYFLTSDKIVVLQIKRASDWQIVLAEKEIIVDFPSHCGNTVLHIIRNRKYPCAD